MKGYIYWAQVTPESGIEYFAYDFRKEVAALVAKGSLVETSKGVFILKDDEYCDGFAIKFFIYNN